MLRTPLVILTVLLAAACDGSGHGRLGGAAKKDAAQEKKTSGGGDDRGPDTEDGEDIKTTEPVQVSGAMLTAECGRAEEERAVVVGAAADAVIFGCRHTPVEGVALASLEVVRGTERAPVTTFAPAGKTWSAVFTVGDLATISAFDLNLVAAGKSSARVRAKLIDGTLPNQPVVTASCPNGEVLVGKACLKWTLFEERVRVNAGVAVNFVYVPAGEGAQGRTNNGGAFYAFKGTGCGLDECKYDATKELLDDGTLPIFRMTKGDEYVYATAKEARDDLVGKGYEPGVVAFRLLPPSWEGSGPGFVRVCRSQNKKIATVHDLTHFIDWKAKILPDSTEWATTPEAQGCGLVGIGRL